LNEARPAKFGQVQRQHWAGELNGPACVVRHSRLFLSTDGSASFANGKYEQARMHAALKMIRLA
jgi:hypothetical protein